MDRDLVEHPAASRRDQGNQGQPPNPDSTQLALLRVLEWNVQ